ncbi:phenoloxidase-activating factor 2-like [Drosophila obscura]|uniref:phenoloxidase-activating factor 2-like n=1 Tax=Drosophila obscura TaxID=7282 RepID=UPI001BB1CF26|nr:phenoloxidase-activating factor 2-like [Drosophila obscura]
MTAPTGMMGALLMIFVLILLTSASYGQEDDDSSEEDPPVFGQPIETTTTTPTTKRCGRFKKNTCVRRDKCEETALNVRKIIIDLGEPPSNTCHYLETCCPRNKIRAGINGIDGSTTHNSQCGVKNVDGIYMTVKGGDLETSFGEYPWVMAIIDAAQKFVCTGTLIAYDVVLTTATCIAGAQQLTVRGGEWDLMTENEFVAHVNIKVKSPILHEKFNWESTENNIALLILERAFPHQQHIAPICLYDDYAEVSYEECFITGWRSRLMRKFTRHTVVKVDVAIDNGTCSVNSVSTVICATEQSTQPIYARGAPMVCPTDSSSYHIIGTWSTRTNGKTFFTDVRQFGGWIREKVTLFGINLDSTDM